MAVLVKGHDGAAAEVPDEQFVAVPARAARRECHAPRGVDRLNLAARVRSGDEAVEPLSRQVQHINQTVSPPGNIILFVGILLGEGHEDQTFDGLDVEWRVSGRRVRIRELADQTRITVVNVHGAFREVRGQKEGHARDGGQGDSFVNRAGARSQNFGGCPQRVAPTGNCAILTYEEEGVPVEVGRVVEHLAGGVAFAGDAHLETQFGHVRRAGGIVRDRIQS